MRVPYANSVGLLSIEWRGATPDPTVSRSLCSNASALAIPRCRRANYDM